MNAESRMPPDAVKRLLAESQARLKAGDVAGAERSCRAALETDPSSGLAWHLLGSLLHAGGRTAEASQAHTEAERLDPENAVHPANLGNALSALGRHAEAEVCLRRALALRPESAEIRNNLANALRAQNRAEEAEAELRMAIGLRPDFDEATVNLARTLQMLRRPAEAEELLRTHVARARSKHAGAMHDLGILFHEIGRFEEADAQFSGAIAIEPSFTPSHSNRGMVLTIMGRLDEAVEEMQTSVRLTPNDANAYNGLGVALKHLRRFQEADAAFRRAVELAPKVADYYRNMLNLILFLPKIDPEERFRLHRGLSGCLPVPPAPIRLGNTREPGRRLKVAYLSSDLRWHSVARSLIPIFAGHDRKRVVLHVYSCGTRDDDTTDRIRGMADVFRSLAHMKDEEMAAAIRADGVDVLVVIASHFDGNRPLVAAYRAAPVQVSWGDVATSGIEAMDYMVSDSTMVPEVSTERFVERVVRMPCCYSHGKLVEGPEPARDAPQRRAGRVTFGSFNNPAKISDDTLALWARLLAAVPGSRLVLKYLGLFGTQSLAGEMRKVFAACGVDPSRIEVIEAAESHPAHLARYEAIDVALDPFPFSGSTTTFEALWMGVPVVTWPQDTIVSRWSASILTAVGLEGLIARSADEYLKTAARLAGDPGSLERLRRGLRPKMEASSIVNGPLHARRLERLYRAMWRRWCAGSA